MQRLCTWLSKPDSVQLPHITTQPRIPSSPFPTTLADLHLKASSPSSSFYANIKALRQATLSIPNRLNSILADATFVQSVSAAYNLPLIANERCGSWYINPKAKAGRAYFKSTDGHHGQWDLSLRRLNLQVLDILGEYGGAVVVDSTRRGKSMPDAFAKTLPIWVAVVNRVLFPEVREWAGLQCPEEVGESEMSQIEARLEGFVKGFRELRLDLGELRRRTKRPVRLVWVANGTFDPKSSDITDLATGGTAATGNTLVLCSASRRVHGSEMSSSGYIQGAGDDSEGWSNGLTPQLFWEHQDELFETLEGDLPDMIAGLLRLEQGNGNQEQDPVLVRPTRNIFLAPGPKLGEGDWDLIINCQSPTGGASHRILDLNCRAGKLGSRDLRDLLGACKSFVTTMFERKQDCRVLITCATGRDLSVGVAVVLLCVFFDDTGNFRTAFLPHPPPIMDKQLVKQRLAWISSSKSDANPSRATLQAVNSFLMDRPD